MFDTAAPTGEPGKAEDGQWIGDLNDYLLQKERSKMSEEVHDVQKPRKYTGTRRPPWIWPEVWQAMSLTKQEQAIQTFEADIEKRLV